MFRDLNDLKDLLMLAPEDKGGAGAEPDAGDKGGENGEPSAKTYTEEEYKAALQRESDKRVNSALAKKAGEYEAQLAEAIKKAKEEAIAETKMTEEEKIQNEYSKKLAELEAKEKIIMQRELKANAIKQLSDKGLDPGFADVIDYNGATDKTIEKTIGLFETALKNQVEQEIKKKMQGNPKIIPENSKTSDDGAITIKEFRKMNTYDKNKLFVENRDLYDSLVKQL